MAAEHGHSAVVSRLLEAGAAEWKAAGCPQPEGGLPAERRTPLQLARANGHAACARLLEAVEHRKHMAAFRIHRFWRDVTCNPAFALCRRRLEEERVG